MGVPVFYRLTPPGRGAVAGVGVEGPGALAIVRAVFQPRAGGPAGADPFRPGRVLYGDLQDGGDPIDEGMVSVRSAERVELYGHGGAGALERMERLLARHGAVSGSPQDPEERWNALLAQALTERALQMLLWQKQGALERALRACLESWDAAARDRLRGTFRYGDALIRPKRIVLAGPPNAGKSTLFNRLLAEDRALTSPIPGTTRDPLEAMVQFRGVPFRLVDTAGIGPAQDPLDAWSQERSREIMRSADLVLWLEGGGPGGGEVPPGALIVDPRRPGAEEAVVEGVLDRLVGPFPDPRDGCLFLPRQDEALRLWDRQILLRTLSNLP